MRNESRPPVLTLISTALISASIIVYEIILMQILSLVQWYHFAYMVISIALLGFGAAGTFLSIFRSMLMKRFETTVPLLMITTGILMSIVTPISQLPLVRFDTYLFLADKSQALNLFLTYAVFFSPFFSAALAIGTLFLKYANSIGGIYFANLAGSGLGGIASFIIIWLFLPGELPAIVAILPVVSGVILITNKTRKFIPFASLATLIIAVFIKYPPEPVMSQFKSLSKTLQLPEAKIVVQKNSPYGLIQVISSPALRFAPGLSLNFKDRIPVKKAIFNNGNWLMPISGNIEDDSLSLMEFTTDALSYVINRPERVLLLNSGTGLDASLAIKKYAREIVITEANPVIIELIKHEFANESDSLYYQEQITIKNSDPRTFLISDTTKFDLIKLPIVGSFEGSTGLYALQEQYILTKESIREMMHKLSTNGVICITSWMDYPLRNPLKVLSTLMEVIEEDISDMPAHHIAAIRSWGTITFILKCNPITNKESFQIREFCRTRMFDPVILPDITPEERTAFNKMQDDKFFNYVDEIMTPGRSRLYNEYDFYLQPATDDRPFFSQFLRWRNVSHLSEVFGSQSIPFFEAAYLFAVLTFIQVSFASVIIIVLPLFTLGRKGSNKLRVLLYFGGIGIGYMFVEIVLIQRFILYFGNPIYSSASVISSMLICSGLGSLLSSGTRLNKKILYAVVILIILLNLIYILFLPVILLGTIAFPVFVKIFLSFLIIAPLSFLMGYPFPHGISTLLNDNGKQIPWAWGINGSFSVISSVLAVIIAVELGFTCVMIFASAAYCLPLIARLK